MQCSAANVLPTGIIIFRFCGTSSAACHSLSDGSNSSDTVAQILGIGRDYLVVLLCKAGNGYRCCQQKAHQKRENIFSRICVS